MTFWESLLVGWVAATLMAAWCTIRDQSLQLWWSRTLCEHLANEADETREELDALKRRDGEDNP